MDRRLRWVGPTLALLLVGLIATGGSGADIAPAAPRRLSGTAVPACSLTSSQEKAAVLAFEEMMPVIRHPRCSNCHGGVNPFVPEAVGGHGGGEMDLPEVAKQCQECHDQLPGWTVTGPPMFFPGRSSKQICMQFKLFEPTGASFVAHMAHDHGKTQFIDAAFKGERALNQFAKDDRADNTGRPFVAEPPPGTRAQLVTQAQDWVNAVGNGWKATPDCGCEIRHNGWIGTASATVTIPGPRYSVVEHAYATVWFELDDRFSKGVPEEYWKSTAGSIRWTVTYTGECVGTFSGTTPIGTTPSGLGADGNPLGLIALKPGNKEVLYSVSNAPWQDRYTPVSTVSCGSAGTLQVAQPRFLSSWWQHDPRGEIVDPDGMHLQGSYQKAVGQGTMKWSWFFRRTTP